MESGGKPSRSTLHSQPLSNSFESMVGMATRLGVPMAYPFREFAALTVSMRYWPPPFCSRD
jgi:hypothetical protein